MAKQDEELIVGLIGEGIGVSRTPAMHEAEGRALRLSYSYRLIDTVTMEQGHIEALLAAAEAEGLRGVNVTHPFKRQVLRYVDARAPEVDRVGASNTVLFTARGRTAYNTDYLGFLHAFRRELGEAPRNEVLLLGAGGAGRAVGFALAEAGVGALVIRDSNAGAAEALAADIRRHIPDIRVEAIAPQGLASLSPDGIVNATPVGMASHPGVPIVRDRIAHRPWVADIVYFPLETELLRTARELGCVTMSGRGMAVMQAVEAFRLFTGLKADPERMAGVFDSFDVEGSEP